MTACKPFLLLVRLRYFLTSMTKLEGVLLELAVLVYADFHTLATETGSFMFKVQVENSGRLPVIVLWISYYSNWEILILFRRGIFFIFVWWISGGGGKGG